MVTQSRAARTVPRQILSSLVPQGVGRAAQTPACRCCNYLSVNATSHLTESTEDNKTSPPPHRVTNSQATNHSLGATSGKAGLLPGPGRSQRSR